MWLTALLLVLGAAGEQCGAPGQRRLTLALRSARNASGHHLSQLSVQRARAADGASRAQAPLEVRLHQGDCAGGRFLDVHFAEGPEPSLGYEAFPGLGRYKMHAEGATWAEARAACEGEGAHLAVLNSEAEAQVLAHMFERAPSPAGLSDNNHAFIGFHDFFAEGQFLTIFGDPINKTGFTRWSGSSQPDNHGFGVNPDSDCGGIHRNGGLNDLPCNWKCIFFCEQPIL